MNDQSYLAHYGVKGMKWGVRRSPAQLGHKPKVKRKTSSLLSKKKTVATKKPSEEPKKKSTIKDLSDDELRRRINRIEMERKYASLTAKQKSKGRKFVEEVLVNAAKQTATKYTAQAMSSVVESAMKKAKSSNSK